MIEITVGDFRFVARFEEEAAPATVAAFRRLLPLDVEDHPLPLERRVELDPLRRARARHRARERDVLPVARRAAALPGRRQRDRAALPVRRMRVREQGRPARRQPLRDDRRGRTSTCASSAAARSGTARRRSRSPSAEPPKRRSVAVSTSTASAMSSSLVSSSGEWLTPPLRLRTKSIPVSTPLRRARPRRAPHPTAARPPEPRPARSPRAEQH